jgi:FkbM family methyltransferase
MSNRQRPLNWRLLSMMVLVAVMGMTGFAAGVFYADRTDTAANTDKRPVLADEVAPFQARFGAPRYSSHEEELFVRDFFLDKRDGVFVDVGASHYKDRSNTYYLESELGWRGLAIDPLVEFAADYKTHRPKTKFFPMFVSNKSDERAHLYVGKNSLFTSANPGFTNAFTDVQRTISAPTITLNDLLTGQGIDAIDFLSIDIELHEPQALAGFNLQKYAPKLVCIEAHPEVRQQILDYFTARGYVVVGKYLRADPQNLWFMQAR